MKTVGKFYEYGTHVKLYGSQYLPEVVDLFREVVFVFLLLCNDADEEGYIIAEALTDIVNGIRCVLDDVMEERL